MSCDENMGNSPDPLRQIVRRALGAALPRTFFITHGPHSSPSVCLTFDDGPHPELTPRVLDVLAAEDVKATFFVMGRLAERHPDLVRRIEGEGHMVGHHSHSHPNPMSVSSLTMLREARQASKTLRDILGHPVRLYRPPHGKLRPLDFIGAWSLGQTIVLWNVDPKDFSRSSSEAITDWFEANPLRGGDLVLLHDTAPPTSLALRSIIVGARRSGLRLDRLDRWIRWW